MVGSIVSAKIATDAADEQQQDRLTAERATADTNELRTVIDNAAVNLERGRLALIDIHHYWRVGDDRSLNSSFARFDRQQQVNIAALERLVIRIGESSPITTNFRAAVDQAADGSGVANRGHTPSREKRADGHLAKLEGEAREFHEAALRVVGSQVGAGK